MAAVWKKRAMAEYSQVIQEPQRKRLRLVAPAAPAPEGAVTLRSYATPQESLNALVGLHHSLPLAPPHALGLIPQLLEQLYQEKDVGVRAKLASVLAELLLVPGADQMTIISDIKGILKNEKSHRVKSQLITCMLALGRSQGASSATRTAAKDAAIEHLKDSSHLVRCKCLELIGSLGSPGKQSDQSEESQQELLGHHTQDSDPRVRCAAFTAMLQWHGRGEHVEQAVYSQACEALSDDHEYVRIAALQLVWVLAQLYADSPVSCGGEETLRLVDDGFAKICNAINDVSLKVRANAASLLGSLHAVSPRFLEQTLDKKLMSNMRRKRSAHERQRENFETGEWSSGRKWADDAPKEEVDAESMSVMSHGACGAFVHGLEDEYLEVRNAAIDSLCELATQSHVFAQLSQDFLVDMLNDEIEGVRHNAIHSLRKISLHIVYREDQLEIILGALKDYSLEIREALHDLFRGARLATKACLNSCVLALLDNLTRYPSDRQSVWRCMCGLGSNHGALTVALAPQLLCVHPYLESLEPDLQDPAYISVLLLVYNGAVAMPTMASMLPAHTRRHYGYLRNTLPDLVPWLQLEEEEVLPPVVSCSSRSHSPPATQCLLPPGTPFLTQTITRLQAVNTVDHHAALQLLKIAIKDLHRVGKTEPHLAATARCHELFLQGHLLIGHLLGQFCDGSVALVTPQQIRTTLANIDQVISMTQQLETLFLGVRAEEVGSIRQLRLRAQVLRLSVVLHTAPHGLRAACVQFVQILTNLNRWLTERGVAPDAVTACLLGELPSLELCDPATFLPVFTRALTHHGPTLLRLDNQVQQAQATIQEPPATSDTPLRFVAGLTVAVSMTAVLDNIAQLQDVRIKVVYPDQHEEDVCPRPGDLRQLGPHRYRLHTSVLLSHAKWSEACSVSLCVGLFCHQDQCITMPTAQRESSPSALHPSPHTVIPLCEPVKVLLAPSTEKR